MHRCTTGALAALTALLLLAPRATAQSFDELLPGDTMFYVSIENTARTKQRFQACSLHELWNHEQMRAFLETPLKKWAEEKEKMKKESGFDLDEVLEVATGQVALAVQGIDVETDEPSGVVLLADVGENAAKLRELAAAAEKRMGDRYRRLEEDFRGVMLVVYRPEEGAAPDAADEDDEGGVEIDAKLEPKAWFVHENLFAMADDTEPLKRLLARRAAGPEGSLAERELYRRARARTGRSPDLCVWVDGPNIVDSLRRAEIIDKEDWPVAEALGLAAVRGLCLQGRLSSEGVFFDMFMPVGGEKRGLLKFWAGENDVVAPPAWVPADAIVASATHLDLNEIYKEVLRVAEAIEEGNAAMVEGAMEKMKQQLGVDLKQDVLGSLGKRFTTYMKAPDPNAPGAMVPAGPGGGFIPMQQIVMAVSVTDQQALEGALAKLTARMPPQMMQESTYLGVKLRSFTMLQQMGMGMVPTFAVLPDQLVLAMRADDVRELIARYGKETPSLADTEKFQRAVEGMPADRMSVAFDDVPRSIRHGTFAGMLEAAPQAQAIFDMDRFPSGDLLAKYLGEGASMIVNAEDGIVYRYRIRLKNVEQPR